MNLKVKCKRTSEFLIKDEWYDIIGSIEDKKIYEQFKYVWQYELYNHTNKVWKNNWHHSHEFYTKEELRELKLNQLGI